MLTPRERVLCALNHEEPDRVPIFFGTSGATTILAPGYDRLKAYWGIQSETKVFWRALQYTLLDEEVIVRFGSDGRPLLAGAIPSTLARDISDDAYTDAWGITWVRTPGNIYPLLNDLIEVGIDLLNPVQVSAADMGDTARLKREFGHRLSFCGAIDTQWALPHGTPDDVRREVRRRIKDLGPGGGYILAAVHCIQPDVPPENIVAMFAEAASAGRYPLAL